MRRHVAAVSWILAAERSVWETAATLPGRILVQGKPLLWSYLEDQDQALASAGLVRRNEAQG